MEAATPGQRFYEEQLKYLAAGDIDGLVENHYAEDGSIIAFAFVVRGRAALKQHLQVHGDAGLHQVDIDRKIQRNRRLDLLRGDGRN